jgi:hypothetical protein
MAIADGWHALVVTAVVLAQRLSRVYYVVVVAWWLLFMYHRTARVSAPKAALSNAQATSGGG